MARGRYRSIAKAAFGIVAVAAVVAALVAGRRHASEPARCPEGTNAVGDRCCAPRQSFEDGRCVGEPGPCPRGFDREGESCVRRTDRVHVAPGRVRIGPGDWEAQGLVAPRDIVITESFEIDRFEVSVSGWQRCVAAGGCDALQGQQESGCPVRSVSFERAERYCRWAGGEVPAEDEWIWVAAGPNGDRYPWGETGAVCRMADWGRDDGPCARGAKYPEWAGLIASDSTTSGVVGLAGGVAEWVRAPEGPAIRGGSFRSRLAAELRTWRRDERGRDGAYDDVGVRCVYRRK